MAASAAVVAHAQNRQTPINSNTNSVRFGQTVPRAAVVPQSLNRQTPIDFNTNSVRFGQTVPALNFNYGIANLSLVNTYNPTSIVPKEYTSVRADVPANAGVLTIGTNTWDLLQFHFHTPSEHSLDSNRAPMEVHFVHKDRAKNVGDPDSLLVVGAFIVRGATNAELEKYFANLPGPTATNHVPGFDLSQVLPAEFHQLTYPGSLTAPAVVPGGRTVTEQLEAEEFPDIVLWVMLTNPIEMADSQIQRFRALYPEREGNSRPLQALAGRQVDTDATVADWDAMIDLFKFNVLPRINITKTVRLVHDNLLQGLSYQLQRSQNLVSWTDFGVPFIPVTSSVTNYVDVIDSNYFFRVVQQPEPEPEP